jgi:hypothetical protein
MRIRSFRDRENPFWSSHFKCGLSIGSRQAQSIASQGELVGKDALMRSEKSGGPSAACPAALMGERRCNSSKGRVVFTLPE